MITGNRLLRAQLPLGLDVEAGPDVDTLRRTAAAAARAQGLSPEEEARVSIVATEMATNLVKYARSGRVFVRLLEWDARAGVELLAVDRGPGMSDAGARAVDGCSTGGTLGQGMGAMARLADSFDMYSTPGRGTVTMARFWTGIQTDVADRRFAVGAVLDAIPGECVSGDAWAVEQRGPRAVVLVVDGLGHGSSAAEASVAAVAVLRDQHRQPVEAIAAAMHRVLRPTRGAAIAVAEIDAEARTLRFCGVGNIAARVVTPLGHAQLMSHYGIAGHQARRIQAFDAEWSPEAMLVMHSDGLSTKWDLDEDDELFRHHPLLTAAVVLRDAERRNDDATVLALTEVRGPAR